MKKTLVSALTTALVVGAASTTFAAANPFADVPADHWAYDAVAQLAADGIVDGYGDGTYRGERNITRYEMAQMVAKAMAKNPSGADKALVDKLAAEFADELNNLGVRVANLERNADKVKWTGEARYTFTQNNSDDSTPLKRESEVLLRLEPTAEVNSHWQAKARLDAGLSLQDDENDNGSEVKLKRVWAQGNYDNFTVKVGKFANTIANDLVFDDPFSGVGVVFGNQLKATVNGGRVNKNTLNIDDTVNYAGIGLDYATGNLGLRAGYQYFDFVNLDDDANVWSVGANYAFDENVALDAVYARSNADNEKTAYAYDLSYKGAEAANQGTWGAWIGYRYLGKYVAFDPTYDVVDNNQKGIEVGAKYTLWKNVVAQAQYGRGSVITTGKDYNTVFGRVEFFF